MSKLNYKQIERLDGQLDKKIQEKINKKFPQIKEDPTLQQLQDKIYKLVEATKSDILKAYNAAGFLDKAAVYGDMEYSFRSADAKQLGKMLGSKNAVKWQESLTTLVALQLKYKKAVEARVEKVKIFRTALDSQKEQIMNDAHFRDAEFALEAIANF